MSTVEFTVPAIPVAQPRQRHRIVQSGTRSFAQNYTPTSHPVNAFKAAVQGAASAAMTSPLQGPLMVWLTFVMPRPAGKIKKRGPNPRLWKSSKPDVDNLIKSVNDALNGIAWGDDSQVSWINAQKVLATPEELPRVIVRIEPSDMPS